MKHKLPLSDDGSIDYESINADGKSIFERSVMLRPLMQTFQVEETDLSYTVTWRLFSATFLSYVFIIAFLSYFCFLGTTNLLNGKDVSTGLLMVFWGLWLYCFGGLLNTLFGKTKFVLDSDVLKVTWTCLFLKQKMRIGTSTISGFKRENYPRNQGKAARTSANWATRIRVVCNNNDYFDYDIPISIMNISAQKEFDEICDQLNAFLENLKAEALF
jgi:hypothetical protein